MPDAMNQKDAGGSPVALHVRHWRQEDAVTRPLTTGTSEDLQRCGLILKIESCEIHRPVGPPRVHDALGEQREQPRRLVGTGRVTKSQEWAERGAASGSLQIRKSVRNFFATIDGVQETNRSIETRLIFLRHQQPGDLAIPLRKRTDVRLIDRHRAASSG
jgi:hypothetical protein